MADYYIKERDIHGTLYRVYAEIADGTQPQAILRLTATGDGDSAVEQSLIDADGQLVVDADVLPELRRLLNDAFRGIGVGAKLEDVGIDLETVRDLYPMAYLDWTEEQDRELCIQWDAGNSVEAIARSLGRQPGAITRRLRRLGLYPEPPASPSSRFIRSSTPPSTPPSSGPPPASPPPSGPSTPPPPPPAQPSAAAPPPPEPEPEFDVDVDPVDTRPEPPGQPGAASTAAAASAETPAPQEPPSATPAPSLSQSPAWPSWRPQRGHSFRPGRPGQ